MRMRLRPSTCHIDEDRSGLILHWKDSTFHM